MKKILISMLAVAALVSCSKEESILVDQGEAIAFGNAFVDNATRAEDKTYGVVDLEAFNVYGTVTGTAGTVNIFNGDAVTGSVGANVWACTNKQYWIEGATYDFAAVVGATVAQDANKMPTTLTTVADDTMNFKDMLYADNLDIVGLKTGNRPVNFTFEHLLAKAFFTVTSNTTGGYYYNVTNIYVSNYESGVYTIDYTDDANGKDNGTWAPVGDQVNVSFGSIENVTAADTNGKTNATQMLLVPTTNSFNVTFTADIYKGSTKLGTETKTIPVDNNLVKGNVYNFKIALSVGEEIQFTVTNDPTWGDTTDVTIQ